MSHLNVINDLSSEAFIQHFSTVLEHCEGLLPFYATMRPFTSLDDAQTKLAQLLSRLTKDALLHSIQTHPKLVVGQAQAGFSQSEQAGAGLTSLTPEEFEHFRQLNETYEGKHHFPFIIAVTGLNKLDILAAMRERVDNPTDVEFELAVDALCRIALIRVAKLVE